MNKQEVWLQVLKNTCSCAPDKDSMMPCDYGMLCDACRCKEVEDEFKHRLHAAGYKPEEN